MSSRPKLEVVVDLKELAKEQGWPNIAVYVFSRSGRLLGKQSLKPDPAKPTMGRAELDIEAKQEALMVKIGPDVEDVGDLQRHNPIVNKVLVTPERKAILSFEILKPGWWCWLKVPYLVTGTVVKQPQNAPICIGQVDIYDVDIGYCFLRLADSIIERIRDSIIDIVMNPPPVKIEETPSWPHGDDDYCGTPPRKPPRPPIDVDIIKKLETLPPEWAFAKQRFTELPMARARIACALEKMPLTEKHAWLNREAVEGVKISQILYSNTAQFRDLLKKKFLAFRFWLCWYPWIYWLWWPHCWWYSLEKLGTAELQPDGSFSQKIWLSVCRQDIPDLWFVVRQEINAVERVIYARHPVPCHTYWNHPSGKPVYLVVTDPNAVACDPLIPVDKTGIYVMPLGIGWDKWYEVQQAHVKPPALLDPNRGLYQGTDPYGTSLNIRMQFHDGLRGIGVWYYRWSYRKEGTSDWTYITTPIIHSYLTVNSAGKPVIEAETLGPKAVGTENNLFLVPDPNKDWVYDRSFAVWNTALWDTQQGKYVPQILDGKYELRLEMFNASGNKVTPATAGFKYFLPTGPAPSVVDDALHVEADGSIIFHLHIDNRYTVADIQSVALGGAATAECQFIEYLNKSDNVAVTYVAYHPNGFLDHYDLSILRGISGTQVASLSPTIPASAPTTQLFTVQSLLRQVGSYGPYEQCAFAVELHTWPRTRDGYSRIRAYEAHDTSAFALVKKTS